LIGVAPAVDGIVALVSLFATGGSLGVGVTVEVLFPGVGSS
jgi:hypothetical protein